MPGFITFHVKKHKMKLLLKINKYLPKVNVLGQEHIDLQYLNFEMYIPKHQKDGISNKSKKMSHDIGTSFLKCINFRRRGVFLPRTQRAAPYK